MNVTSILALSTALISCLAAVGCSADVESELGAAADELASRSRGIELEDASGLKLHLRHSLASASSALKSLERRVTVTRGGESFSASCGVGGRVSASVDETTVRCTKFTSAVDERQSLEFSLVARAGSYSLEGVKLRGAELRDDEATLTGGAGGAVKLAVKYQSTDAKKNPFAAAERVRDALVPLIGKDAFAARENKTRKVRAFEYSLDEYLAATANLQFTVGRNDGYVAVNLLSETFDATSSLVAPSKLAEDVEKALPSQPVCKDGAPTGGSAEKAIQNALSPLGGPELGLSHEVEVSAVPAAVRTKMQRVMREIRARSFGTDYSADVAGAYAVHRSCADDSVVGYAVWGTGSGEPDYHDGIVVGWDTAGNEVVNEEDNG